MVYRIGMEKKLIKMRIYIYYYLISKLMLVLIDIFDIINKPVELKVGTHTSSITNTLVNTHGGDPPYEIF